jgi:hypothetical protein
VAWRKRNPFRNVQIQRKCGPQKKLAFARREMTHSAKVVRRKENIFRNKWTRAKDEREIQKARTCHESRKGMKDLGGGRSRYLRKRDLKKLRIKSTGNLDTTFSKTTRLEIAKLIARSTVGMRGHAVA